MNEQPPAEPEEHRPLVIRIADWLAGPQPDRDQRRRVRTVVLIGMIGAANISLLALINTVLYPSLVLPELGIVCIQLIALLLVKHTKTPDLSAHLTALTLATAVHIAGYTKGDINATPYGWMAIVVMGQALYFDWRKTLAWTTVMSASLFAVPWLNPTDPAELTGEPPMEVAAAKALMCFASAGMALAWEASRSRAFAALEARRRELRERNRDMRTLLDNVDQGFLTVDMRGRLLPERSAMAEALFGKHQPGERLGAALGKLDPRSTAMTDVVFTTLESASLPLEICLSQLPRDISHDDKQYRVDYKPLSESGDDPESLLVVISDVTSESEQRELLGLFERMLRDRRGFATALHESASLVQAISSKVESEPATVLRNIHTLKGIALLLGLKRLAAVCHDLEGQAEQTDTPLTQESRKRVSDCWTMCSGPALKWLEQDDMPQLDVSEADLGRLLDGIRREMPYPDLAHMVDALHLESSRLWLSRLGEQARQIARRLSKGSIAVHIEHNDLRIPQGPPWTAFWAALPHVVRNSVDHGLESKRTRRRAGKDPRGTLKLSTRVQDDRFVVTVEDDGKGIDWQQIERKAKELGLPHQTQQQLEEALFANHLSTRETATELSGRGLGMGAARDACRALGGRIRVLTRTNEFTRVEFDFPHAAVSTKGSPSAA